MLATMGKRARRLLHWLAPHACDSCEGGSGLFLRDGLVALCDACGGSGRPAPPTRSERRAA